MESEKEDIPGQIAQVSSTSNHERRRREAALQSLARAATDQPAFPETGARGKPSAEKDWRFGSQTRSRRFWLFGGIIVVLVVATLGAITEKYIPSHLGVPNSAPAVLRIDLASMGYICPAAMGWSSTGASLAVLAQRGKVTAATANDPCGNSDAVLVFDSRTGKLKKAYPLGAVLNHAEASISPSTALSWALDDSMIALACVVANHRRSGWATDAGVMLVPISSGQPYIIHGFVDMSPTAEKTVAFDVHTRDVAGSAPYPLQAASDYALDSAGRISIERPFASVRVDSPFAGSPSGNGRTSASFWSSGVLIGISPSDSSNSRVVYFTGRVAIWSAGGAYVDPSLEFGAAGFVQDEAALATINPQRCAEFVFVPCLPTPIPYADRALVEARMQVVEELGVQPYLPNSPVAWRPDGKILATIYPANYFTNHSDMIRVTLLATSDGHTVKTLTTASSSSYDAGSYATLSWSPTGDQLAFRDPVGGVLTLWGGSSL